MTPEDVAAAAVDRINAEIFRAAGLYETDDRGERAWASLDDLETNALAFLRGNPLHGDGGPCGTTAAFAEAV